MPIGYVGDFVYWLVGFENDSGDSEASQSSSTNVSSLQDVSPSCPDVSVTFSEATDISDSSLTQSNPVSSSDCGVTQSSPITNDSEILQTSKTSPSPIVHVSPTTLLPIRTI